jgi:hypothetical protein
VIAVAKKQDNVAQSKVDLQPPSAVVTWTDPRLLFMWIMPLGTMVWAGLGVFVLYTVVFVYQPQDWIDKIGIALVMLFAVSTSSWVVYGNAQALFFELRERFIVWRLTWDGDVFQASGYYLKRASFRPGDVTGVEQVILSERWFQKRIGSFLSRNTRFTQPHGKHINLRIILADGRVFYLPGELGCEGRWKDEDVVQLREWMERLSEENQKSERLS